MLSTDACSGLHSAASTLKSILCRIDAYKSVCGTSHGRERGHRGRMRSRLTDRAPLESARGRAPPPTDVMCSTRRFFFLLRALPLSQRLARHHILAQPSSASESVLLVLSLGTSPSEAHTVSIFLAVAMAPALRERERVHLPIRIYFPEASTLMRR
jgi:hypothetical protein